jgi:hypothetical protein
MLSNFCVQSVITVRGLHRELTRHANDKCPQYPIVCSVFRERDANSHARDAKQRNPLGVLVRRTLEEQKFTFDFEVCMEKFPTFSPNDEITEEEKQLEYVMGVDEAGRGPILGPMVYGAAWCLLKDNEKLGHIGFKGMSLATPLNSLFFFRSTLSVFFCNVSFLVIS